MILARPCRLFRSSFAGLLAILVVGGCPPATPSTDAAAEGSDDSTATLDATADGKQGDATPGDDDANDTPDGAPGVGDEADLSRLQVFPSDNPWNQPASSLPLHPNSDNLLATIGLDTGLHPDFGTVWEGAPIGIPFNIVTDSTPRSPVEFDYADESDAGPYPIPADPLIEGGPEADGDRHILMLDVGRRKLYELFYAWPGENGWTAGSGAIWDLASNDLRPLGWTSADAAGLPIFAGLVRYDEVVERGEIRHALRFTVSQSRRAYILPATHFASSSTDPNRPPMGLRVRLKANYDISGFSPHVRVILQAMKTYGMIVADNGSNWYVSGVPDPRWDDDELRQLGQVKGRDFEVVYTGEAITD
ncbi:hypothetical protein RAS1_31200 [Phycisphaerae bacterium RAS1]|nr:hypothetical protein RAS1_31200 [Phycisphaerae bacterium RAS1]